MTFVEPLRETFAPTVNGADYPTDATFDVINPATGEALAQAPAVTASALDDAFGAAATAYEKWRRDDDLRRDHLRSAAGAVAAAADHLAPVLTAEQGKPLADARNEILAASAWLSYYADLELPREVIRDDEGGYEEVFRRPLGVVAAITPWNFPIALAMWKIAPALRAGNTIVAKPSPFTPLTTLALGRVLREVLPDGVLNVLSGPDPLGAAMVEHPVPRKVSFTGSTATGKKVAISAAADLKRVTLELGGNDPAIVLGDVDVNAIAEQLFWGAFGNNGQICLAVKRVYAHESIHSDLVAALAELATATKVDEGTVEGVQLGPINNKPQFDRVNELVSDALGHGARAVAGGSPLDRPGYFYAPTILDNIDDGVRVVDEEQFGPVLPVVPFRDETDAVSRANRSQYGLTASVWSGDPEHASKLAAEVDSGQVAINSHGAGVQMHLPFGGHKWSGIGVENGPWGLYGFSELQVIAGPPRKR
ncbi:aldehyde dehydrogenase family protein [Streptomyces sp. ISL-100]|uniref:aldehyde dehydrogenase family protein n=1 Tax=Streptomyces sp. ISL-100 TaxID=2819173 RepID=UPI001BECA642|nr:aldehyde dehydrogenase family protein [Streptomyces sp. ISL-100]MBT2399248.1 aldehyde dehydrogenase family protein [Streptomyces sp. ISL-100]